MNKTVKKLILGYSDWAYHSRSKKLALQTLKSIEGVKGKTDRKLIELSDQYAADVLGWKGYAPWLYVYSALNQEFKEGWMPDTYFGKVVVPKLKGNYGTIADYNSLTGRLFESSNFPTCAYYVNGLWLSPDYRILSCEEVLETALLDSAEFVYKTDKSRRGLGVHFVKEGDLDIKKLEKMGNGVLQKYINQHSLFSEIMPNSVATLRITSAISSVGIVSIRACFLRVGRTADPYVKSSSHLRIPVNIYNGSFSNFGYTTDWVPIESHPDTNFIFEGNKIPEFDSCKETVRQLHQRIPFARTVGWDVIVDINDKVQVMEWNGSHHDVKFTEATQGPSFSDFKWENLWKETD